MIRPFPRSVLIVPGSRYASAVLEVCFERDRGTFRIYARSKLLSRQFFFFRALSCARTENRNKKRAPSTRVTRSHKYFLFRSSLPSHSATQLKTSKPPGDANFLVFAMPNFDADSPSESYCNVIYEDITQLMDQLNCSL